jgi:hypothetical protein
MVLQKYTEKGCSRRVDFKNNIYNGLAILRCKWQYCFKGQFVNGKKSGIWQFLKKEN